MNEARIQCHGDLKKVIVKNPNWDLKCQVAPRLSQELKKHLMDLLRAKLSVPTIYDLHCIAQCNRASPDRDCLALVPLSTLDGRDDLVEKRDLYNLLTKVLKEKVRLNENDQISVQMWMDKNRERVVFHRQHQIGPPAIDFILALQSPWQLAQMIELSHKKALTMDSTFATNNYKVH